MIRVYSSILIAALVAFPIIGNSWNQQHNANLANQKTFCGDVLTAAPTQKHESNKSRNNNPGTTPNESQEDEFIFNKLIIAQPLTQHSQVNDEIKEYIAEPGNLIFKSRECIASFDINNLELTNNLLEPDHIPS